MEGMININQVNYSVYQSLIASVFEDYQNTFNAINPTRRVGFSTTLTNSTLNLYDVLLKQGKYNSKEEIEKAGIKNDKMEVRYLRVGKYFEKLSYTTPILEEFKIGFRFQQLDIVGKSWEEVEFEEGDTMSEEKINKNEVRVERRIKEPEVPIYQQSLKLKNQKEVLNDKYWKRVLYLDLLNTLMAKGIEYGEVLGLIQKSEEEKAVLAKELGDNAMEVLKNNNIVIRKDMPAPLTKEDKAYVEHVKKAKHKDGQKD